MGIKVFVMSDMEGASGVVDFDAQTQRDSRYYEEARELVTAEVNAAIEGAMAAGADDILVIDAHGPGGLKFTDLHPEARLIMGRPLPIRGKYMAGYDVAFQIAQHAKMGSGGNLEHTHSSRSIHNMWINGEPVGELEMKLALAGELGIPTVLVTGDDVVVREARAAVPGIETVVVKEAITQTSAICISPVKARQRIRAAAERAVSRRNEIAPYRIEGPVELIIEYAGQSTSSAYVRAKHPDVELIDTRKVRIRASDMLELWRKL